MKYRKADAVLPQALLEELQRYAEGELLYIPKRPGSRMAWGTNTGSKEEISRRNQEICREYQSGESLEDLAARYYLSVETLKKIVYRKK